MISYYSHGYCHEYFPGTITSRTFVSRASGFISFVPPRGQRIERKRKREREREREKERERGGTIFIRFHFCPKNSNEIRRVFGSERLGPKIRGRNKQIRTSVALATYYSLRSPWILVGVLFAGPCRGRQVHTTVELLECDKYAKHLRWGEHHGE